MFAVRRSTSVLAVFAFLLVAVSAHAETGTRRITPGDIPNEYLVSLNVPRADVPRVAREIAGNSGGTVLNIWQDAIRGFHIRIPDQRAHMLLWDRRVTTVEQNATMHASGRQATGQAAVTPFNVQPTPGGAYPESFQPHPLWHLTRLSHRTREFPTVSFDDAAKKLSGNYYHYDYCTGSTPLYGSVPVVVYVIDSGVLRFHQEWVHDQVPLAGDHVNPAESSLRLIEEPGSNVLATAGGLDQLPSTAPHQVCGGSPHSDPIGGYHWWYPDPWFVATEAAIDHGLAAASALGGRNVGVAKDVQIIPVKAIAGCEAQLTAAGVVSGANYVYKNEQDYATRTGARRGAIASISTFRSLCKNCNVPPTPTDDVLLIEAAIASLTDFGIPVFAAANNQKIDACLTSPARMSRRGGRGRVVTVGGLAKDEDKTFFTPADPPTPASGSNYGACVDIFGPAEKIPVARANGWSEYRSSAYTGTSYSTPMVAGIAARLMVEDPSLLTGLNGKDANGNIDVAQNIAVTDRIWQRISDSATRWSNLRPPASATTHELALGDNSPELLAYAGPLTITTQPKSINVPAGTDATLTVGMLVADGVYRYEWKKSTTGRYEDSDVAPGVANAKNYVVQDVSGTGYYWVRVHGKCTSSYAYESYTDSAMAVVTAGCAVIKTQPKSHWATTPQLPDELKLFVEIETGAAVESAQWYQGKRGDTSTPIGEATTPEAGKLTLTLDAGDLPAISTYWVRITGTGGCKVDSDIAQIRTCAEPAIASATVGTPDPNGIVKVTINAIGTEFVRVETGSGADLRYELMTPDSSKMISISPIRDATYRLIPMNDCKVGAAYEITISQPAVCNLTSGEIQTQTPHVNKGDVVVLEAIYKNRFPMPPVEWFELDASGNASPPIGNFPTLRIPALTKTTEYRAVWTRCGRTSTAEMKIYVRPEITQHPTPVDNSVPYNGSVTLTADGAATGSEAYTTQWYVIEGNASARAVDGGADVKTLTINNVTRAAKYFLRVTITSALKFPVYTDSRPANVTVFCPPPKRRAVRHALPLDPLATSAAAKPGDPVLLSVDEPESDVTYQWYSENPAETLDNGATVTVHPIRTTTYWAVGTRNCGESTSSSAETDRLTIVIACPLTVEGPDDQSTYLAPNATEPARITVGVAPTGYGPFTYHWFVNDNPLTAEPTTNASYTWSSSTPGQQQVHVVVRDACGGSAQSRTATLTIASCPLPTIGAYWGSGWVYVGGQGKSVGVSIDPAGETYTYQWYRGDGTPISGKTTAQTTLSTYDLDSYYVTITNSCGAKITSKKVYLYVYGECLMPPLTVGQSASSISAGQSVTFTATCDFNDVSFQWYSGVSGDTRNPISNATSSTYNANAVGSYWVRAWRSCGGHVDSSTLMLSKGECDPNIITQHPQSNDVAYGATGLTLTVAPMDEATKNFFWHKAEDLNTVIATGQTLTLPSPFTESGRYVAVVRDQTCASTVAAESFPATVRVASCPSITPPAFPSELWAERNEPAKLTATAAGATGYQWYRGEVGDTRVAIPNGTGNEYITDDITADTKYWVRIFGNGCIVDSPTITVRVCDPPAFAPSFRTNDNIVSGQTTRFWANATGSDLSYEWFEGPSLDTSKRIGRNIDMIEVRPHVTTEYWVRVTGHCGESPLNSPTITASVCPTISEPTATKTVVMPGTTTQLSVTAEGTRLQYQWYIGESGIYAQPIPNSNSPTITSPPITAATKFWCAVKSGGCERPSASIQIVLCSEPTVEWAHGDKYVAKSERVDFRVNATSTATPFFTFYNGPVGNISASTVAYGPTMSAGFSEYATETKTYWARAVDGDCHDDTSSITVNVCVPTIMQQPAGDMYVVGSTTPVRLSITTDMQPLGYQWYRGDVGYVSDPAGSTPSIDVAPSVDTKYWVRLTACGGRKVDSAAALVTACNKPNLVNQTTSHWVALGTTLDLHVHVDGTGITHAWYKGVKGDTSNRVANPSGSSIRITPTETVSYWARSTGTCGVKDSETITISVCAPPDITEPQVNPIFPGSQATITVAATTATNTPLTYQWYSGTSGNGTAISGATSATYKTPALSAPANYWVEIMAGDVRCTSASETITVPMCAFPQQVSGSEIKIGRDETATLSLPPLSPVVSKNVTWYRGAAGDISTPVRSGVNVSYTTPALTATTQYWAEFEYQGCVSRTTTYTVNVCKPSISAQPVGRTIQSGGSAPLSIGTTNIPGQTITWYAGAVGTTTTQVGTGASISVTPSATTSYWARVSSCGLNADSLAVTVTVCTPPQPTIVTPSPRYIRSGQTTSLQTYAPGSNITYQWYVGNSGVISNPINGQTTDWLQVSPATNTNYWCKVTSYGTCVTNGPTITVDVCDNPTINVQPLSQQRVFSGTATSLSVSASSSRPLTYQWYRGSTGDTSNPIGSASSSPSVTVSPAAETSYWVRVLNGVCSTDSATATISMCTFNPTYSGSETKIGYGETATISLPTLSPVVNKNVTWYRGAAGDISAPVRSGVNVSYTTPQLTATTTYWAEFEYEGCYSRTTAYTVNVCKPSISTPPSGKSIAAGQSATLSITTTNIPGQTITWYSGAAGNTSTPVGTGASITVSPASTTTYWVRVSSCGLNADSAAVTVSVCTAPAINIVTPSPRYIKSGTTTSLQTYSSSPSVTYQWYVGTSGTTSSPISGQTTDWYQASPASTTSYWCKVTSNGTCVTNGPTITVNVCNLPTISVQPQSQRIFPGKTVTLSVSASSPTHTLSYQWYRGAAGDTTNPIGSASASPNLTVSPASETSYWVAVTTSGARAPSTARRRRSRCARTPRS